MDSDQLKQAIRRLTRRPRPTPVDLAPTSTYDALLDQRINNLEQQIAELKQRTNGLIALLIGAVAVEVILNLLR